MSLENYLRDKTSVNSKKTFFIYINNLKLPLIKLTMENKEEKKTFWKKHWLTLLIAFICVFILSVAVKTYLNTFDGEFSKSQPVWGAFGDYMNPFLTLINTILFIYFTYTVSKLDEHREKDRIKLEDIRLNKSLDVQRQITLSQMMNEKLIPISNILDKINSSFDYGLSDNIKIVEEVQKDFNLFNKNSEYLFEHKFKEEDFKNNSALLAKSFDDIIKAINSASQALSNVKVFDEQNPLFDIEKVFSKGFNDGKNANQSSNEITEKENERIALAHKLNDSYAVAKKTLENYLKYKDEYIKKLSLYILYQLKKQV